MTIIPRQLEKLRVKPDAIKIISETILPRIPEEHRGEFLQYALPPIVRMEPAGETWKTIEEILPDIPKESRSIFFEHGLNASLQHNPTPDQLKQTWKTITELLPQIPQEHHYTFFKHVLPASLQHNPTPDQLKQTITTIAHSLPQIPQEYRSVFFEDTLPAMLRYNPTPDQLKQTWKTITELLPQIPQEHHYAFFKLGLPTSMKMNQSPREIRQTWKTIAEILPKIPGQDHWRFFEYALPETLQHNPTPDTLKTIAGILPKIHQRHRLKLFRYGLPETLDKKPTREQFAEDARIAESYLSGNPNYFFGKLVAENFGRLKGTDRAINRLKFRKTGSTLVALGGKYGGRVIIRTIRPEAYREWEKAANDRILKDHVEPILTKNGRYRAYNRGNRIQVTTRYAGERMSDYVLNNPGQAEEVEKQRKMILERFKKKNIKHRHPHHRNFVVEEVQGKPLVRLIDFD